MTDFYARALQTGLVQTEREFDEFITALNDSGEIAGGGGGGGDTDGGSP